MTVSYNHNVCSASATAFICLLFRWRGSIWKCVLKELLIWTILYLLVAFFYRSSYFLSEHQKVTFEETASYFEKYLKTMHLTFILGFFVSTVATRWTSILTNMGYIESNALFVSSYISGSDDEGRMIRRAVLRYLCLSQVMVYRDISVSVRKRFPTMDSLIKAGYLLEHEKLKLESYDLSFDKYWVPINWAASLVFKARKTGRITGDILVNRIMDEIKAFRSNLQILCTYDWVPLPLVYPQVVFIAVYFHFGICLFSRQFIITTRNAPNKSNIDLVLPVMTMLQFLFYVGWMKVAMALLNPLGEDDDDFECNFLLNKNLATSLTIVDNCSGDAPVVKEDQFYESGVVEPLYPETSIPEDRPLIGSAAMADVNIKSEQLSRAGSTVKKRSFLRKFNAKRNTIHCVQPAIPTIGRIRTQSDGMDPPTGYINYGAEFVRATSCPFDHQPLPGQKYFSKRRSHASGRSSLADSNILSTLVEEEVQLEKRNPGLSVRSEVVSETQKSKPVWKTSLVSHISMIEPGPSQQRTEPQIRSVSFSEPVESGR